MGQIALNLPQVGQTNATQEPLIPGDFTTVQNVINGNLDATNVSAALAQSAAVNQSGQTVKGAVSIAASESRTNVAYGTLATPDQVTGIVLPANGLIAVWYEATWRESVAPNDARAAIFLGANQVKITSSGTAPVVVEALVGDASTPNIDRPLSTYHSGLQSPNGGSAYTGDVTTGQVVGSGFQTVSGPCYIFAAAGTYTVSIQFRAATGTVTGSNRKLWVSALSFS